ncbi:S46 family peptidase [Psychrosphaera aquimarina]|uniref:Dipeptidyl-peptidase n=1 Tax=Psychrosphaera aquimarina TaxID=2044854 RepID=A0ABU3R2L9_9GAMM|nr:S46 family peptidase [Psychrosphaera aquimarina]MDU0113932.1 S46 family peptidase [Psychrosphaera aquimarina]
MITRLLTTGIIASSLLFGSAIADEGMWQPHQLAQIKYKLKAAGLKLDPEKMADLNQFPMNAIVSLGGCSASFLSEQGLVITNHHCAYGSIQHNSTEENNLLVNGFVAKTMEQEPQASPSARVYVTESLTDVTKDIKGSIPKGAQGVDYFNAIDKREKELVAECEASQDYRCNVYSFHGGAEYFLIKQLAIRDVRLVYAPPSNIGKFGGDTDNWMWPRHTGDWSFYRAYVNKDGQPADFSTDNVPFKPKAFLKVNANGVEKDDYVMVLGYPGRTNRYRTDVEVESTFTNVYPTSKRLREEFIDVIKANSEDGSEARIKYESTIAGLANYAKNYGSMIESFNKGDMLDRKKQLTADLTKWINSDKKRKAKYGNAIDNLAALIIESNKTQDGDIVMGYLTRSTMMRVAKGLYRLAHEKQKPNVERRQGFQERDMKRFGQYMAVVNKRFDETVEKALFMHFVKEYSQLPVDQRNATFDAFFNLQNGLDLDKVAAQIESMYANTELTNTDVRLAWMEKSVDEFKASNDPFIQYAVSQFDNDMIEEEKEKAIGGKLQQARPAYMEAMIAFKKSRNEAVYADANSSLRITYGNVKGYSPQDGITATPFTTLEGMLAKYVPGDDEFDLFDNIRTAIKEKKYGPYKKEALGSVPVNYLTTLDITGGNSGSATLNANGEFVGLIFDGVYESIIGDWDYDPTYNRSIHVSVPYMLWVMEYIDGANNIIDEMTIVK